MFPRRILNVIREFEYDYADEDQEALHIFVSFTSLFMTSFGSLWL